MSLQSRARALQTRAGITYQTAINLIRGQKERPARLAAIVTGWSLKQCDAHLLGVDDKPGLTSAEVEIRTCQRCKCDYLSPTSRRSFARSCNWCIEFEQRSAYEALVVVQAAETVWTADSPAWDVTGRGPTRAAALRDLKEREAFAYASQPVEDYSNAGIFGW